MNKLLHYLLSFLIIFTCFGFTINTAFATTPPPAAFVEANTPDETLEPLKYVLMETSISPGVDATDADVCNYLGAIFVLLIGIAGVLSVLIMFIAALEFMLGGANPSARNDAKDRMWGALIGLLISLISWLLLNSINPVLLKGCFDADYDNTIVDVAYVAPANQNGPIIEVNPTRLCLAINETYDELEGVTATDPEDGNITDEILPYGDEFTTNLPPGNKLVAYVNFFVEDSDGNVGEATRTVYIGYDCTAFEENIPAPLTDPDEPFDGICNRIALVEAEFSAAEVLVRDELEAAGYDFNKGACPDLTCSYKVVTGGCSSFEALPVLAIDQLKKLKTECTGCGTIMLTGGTEAGHLTHGPGLSVVDITRGNSALNLYITNTATQTGITSNGKWRYWIVPVGTGTAFFMDEVNHWHVVF